jgi:hypothetical protein
MMETWRKTVLLGAPSFKGLVKLKPHFVANCLKLVEDWFVSGRLADNDTTHATPPKNARNLRKALSHSTNILIPQKRKPLRGYVIGHINHWC